MYKWIARGLTIGAMAAAPLLAACSSAQTGTAAGVKPVLSSGPSTGSGKASRSGPLRVVYDLKFLDGSDPNEQTQTVLSDGARKFRVTWTPTRYLEWVVSDGLRGVQSSQHGHLDYLTPAEVAQDQPIVTSSDLPTICPGAKPIGRKTILSRTGIRYLCQDTATGLTLELTLESDTGLILSIVASDLTQTVTSIDLHPTIPAGSFDLSAFPISPTAPPSCLRGVASPTPPTPRC
jgi:hypothetical protein